MPHPERWGRDVAYGLLAMDRAGFEVPVRMAIKAPQRAQGASPVRRIGTVTSRASITR